MIKFLKFIRYVKHSAHVSSFQAISSYFKMKQDSKILYMVKRDNPLVIDYLWRVSIPFDFYSLFLHK